MKCTGLYIGVSSKVVEDSFYLDNGLIGADSSYLAVSSTSDTLC